jgi:hypothetical protein
MRIATSLHHNTQNEPGFIMLELLISYNNYRIDKAKIVVTDPMNNSMLCITMTYSKSLALR